MSSDFSSGRPDEFPDGSVVIDTPVLERKKPCCARMRSLSGSSWWCHLEDGHSGDHHGLCDVEATRVVGEYRKGMR